MKKPFFKTHIWCRNTYLQQVGNFCRCLSLDPGKGPRVLTAVNGFELLQWRWLAVRNHGKERLLNEAGR